LPISTGVSGLGTGVATFLATPSSTNLRAAVTDETGTGSLVFATSPTLTTAIAKGAGTTTGTAFSVVDSASTGRVTVYDNGFTGFGGLPTTGQRVTIYPGDSNGSQLQIANTRAGGHSWIFGAGDTGSSASIVPAGGFFFYDINGTGGAATRFVIDGSGNVGIGTTTPSAKSIMDLTSTTKGFLPPRMTTAQRDAITSVPAGLTIYNTDTNRPNYYNNSAWSDVVSSNSTDTLTNKTLTSPAINSATIGTAATFNATTYTFGAGAAEAFKTGLAIEAGDITDLGSNVATFLISPSAATFQDMILDYTGTGYLVMDYGPVITNINIDTAATFNATSYTYGTGAAAAMNQSLGTSSVDSRISSLFSAPYNFVQDNFVGKAIVVSGYYGQLNWGIVGSASLSSDVGYYVSGFPGATSISTNNNAFFLYLFGTSAANIALINNTVFDLVFNTSTATNTVQNFFVGLRSNVSATVETGRRGLSFEAGVDTNWQLLHETSAGVQTKIDTGKPALSNQTVRVTIKFVSATQTDMIIATSTSTTPVTVSATSGFSFTGFCGIGMWLKSTTAVTRILVPLRATLAWLSPTL
jgi:hypothetical protein